MSNPAHTLVPSPIGSDIKIGLSLVIPTYNERETIAPLLKSICHILTNELAIPYEVWVVDDNSPDGTWAIAQQLATQYPQIQVLRRQRARGLASAAVAGWQRSQGRYLALMDGDLQHPPEVLRELVAAMEAGGDLAIASRNVSWCGMEGWSVWRRVASWGARTLGVVILPEVVGRVRDPMSGYFMVRREAIANCTLQPIGYKLLLEVLAKGKIEKIQEVGYHFQARQGGQSKVGWIHYWEYLRHLLQLRRPS